MVATLVVKTDIGGSNTAPQQKLEVPATGPNIPASIRFKTADDNTINIQNPIPIPQGNTPNNSFWKSMYIECKVAPDTSITNFRIYTDGTGFGDGILVNIGDTYPLRNSGTTSGYVAARGVVGTSGNEITTTGSSGYNGISDVTNLFEYTNTAQLKIPDATFISETGNIINAENECTNYFVLQARVSNNATPGTKNAETITIVYDEV